MGRVQVQTQFSYPSPHPQPQSPHAPPPGSPQPQPQSRSISHGAQPYQQPPQQFYEHQLPNKYVVPVNDNNNMQLVNNPVYTQECQQPSSSMQMIPQGIASVPSKASFQNTTAIGIPHQQVPMSPLQVINNNSSNNMMAMAPWTTGLFDCMDDPTNACATSGIIYAAAPCLVSRPYRKKLRQRFGLVEAPSSDWIVHSIFEPCALCQAYRELANRGLDPALGYQGNLKKQQAEKNPTPMEKPTSPPLPQAMPLPSTVDRTNTFIGAIPVNATNQSDHVISNNSHASIPWSTGLCDCCDDVNTCCLTCWCPCITFGRIAEIVDRGSTSCGVSGALYTLILCLTGCSCLYSCFYRSKLRGQYFLEERPCTDCCIHCCCEGCALCQEYRELMHHGFDMSIGWHGNMQRQKRFSALQGADITR
ncbi:hypothetical protein Ddye_030633 [Dipteronia dyeriana]|uniref:Uncharacterized protein n=1 Tax=Dipteronia dyeriana TaxID=168575 RepID=A0AAD9THF2_9ROSI|nr:hypothetical protein Ddye_030633 [Dipteronia dyeriana]